jgi:hypothetical protein
MLNDYKEEDMGLYKVRGYYDRNYRGLSDSEEFRDFSKAIDFTHEIASRGSFVVISNYETGVEKRYTPDEWMEAIEFGEVPEDVKEVE